MPSGFSLLTWNVNSIRARLDNTLAYIDEHEPDVICLQETKVEDRLFPKVPFMEYGYKVALHGTKGYSGVAIMTKEEPEEVVCGFREGEPDKAPRILNVKVGGVRIYGLYCPNGTELGSEAFEYKMQWYRRLRAELDAHCSKEEPLILCGDFNIAPDARDVWDEAEWKGRLHYTDEEHEALAHLLDFGLQDCFRKHVQEGGHFTFYDYQRLAWEKDHGLRIDHVYATSTLFDACTDVFQDKEVRGWDKPTDHVPVRAIFAAT